MRKNPFNDFIRIESSHFSECDSNRLVLAAGQASRYYDYLSLILERYAKADKALRIEDQRIMALSRANPDGFPISELGQSARIRCELHLEIESFYVFAKILLDKVAHLVLLYFGPARDCSMESHRKFLKCCQVYFEAKKLKGSQGLVDLMTHLRDDIVHFRDKKLTHQNNPRVSLGTAFPEDQGAYLSAGYFYPKTSDEAYQSRPLDSLIDDLDKYIRSLLFWMVENREHTALQIME